MPKVAIAFLLVALAAAASALDLGKPAPAWTVSDARGLPKEVTLESLRGKWVLIEFWAHWCGPCTGASLPALARFQEAHKDQADQFQIIAFHEESGKNFKQLDPLLKKLEKSRWKGKPLPFPILLDASGATTRAFGVRAYPTLVLIDPQGNVAQTQLGAGPGIEQVLVSKLKPAAPAATQPAATTRPATGG